MFEQFTQYSDLGFFVLRLAVAGVFIYHAVPKLRDPKGMAQAIGFRTEMVSLLGAVELLSSLGLILGIQVQLSALLLAIVMAGAIYFKTTKWNVPFMATDKTGWEFDLTLLAANIAIFLTGGGVGTIYY